MKNEPSFFLRQKILQKLLIGLLFFSSAAWIPQAWQSRLAPRWFHGDRHLQEALAKSVEEWMNKPLTRKNFSTSSKQFDGEWLYGTYLMSALGFFQMAQEHPEQKTHYAAQMEKAIDLLLKKPVRQFDTESWNNSDPLESLDSNEGHAAYLGYLNLAMSLHRSLNPQSKFIALNNKISTALRRRIEASPTLLIATYPEETYPLDNCTVMVSLFLNAKIRNQSTDLSKRWIKQCRKKWIDPKSGLLFQGVNWRTGQPGDAPRGSGTTLGLYFLSFMDPTLSRDLYTAVKRELASTLFGFGFVREYPNSIKNRSGDIDSGPLIFGYSISSTGFALGGARIHHDPDYFRALYASASAAGAPLQTQNKFHFVTGGPLGDAILFAMLTAQSTPEI